MRNRTLRSRSIRWGIAALGAAAVMAPGGAHAVQIFSSDCNFGFQNVYNPGDAVCVTGEMDVVPPGKICAEGYVYVIPVGHPNPFADITKPGGGSSPNYILGCAGAGAFYDEYIWLPPLKPGSYELVLDQYPFAGAFDPLLDIRTGQAFTVSNAPIVYSVNPAAIKAAAKDGLKAAKGIYALTQALAWIDVLGTAADWALSVGPWFGVFGLVLGTYCNLTNTDCPTSYNSAVITIGNKILNGIADSLSLHYTTLINDPPDPNFLVTVPLDLSFASKQGAPWTPNADQDLPRGQIVTAGLLAVQAGAYKALIPSLEKLQGAQQAGDNLGLLLQSEKVKTYAKLVDDAGDKMLVELDKLQTFLSSKGTLDTGVDGAIVQAAITEITTTGLSPADDAKVRSFGLGDADIAMVKAKLAQATIPPKLDYAAVISAARDTYLKVKPALADLEAQAEKIRAENEPNAFRPGPQVTLTPAPAGKVGVPMTLTASATYFDPSATLTYAWDTNMDGKFDDGTGPSVTFTPGAPGPLVVTVEVSDPAAHKDTAQVIVDVTLSNAPPEITAITPSDPAPFADVGQATSFHVDTVDADGDPLTITWMVDGAKQGTGADFSFMMPDQAPHKIQVVVADTNKYSPDAMATRVVRASKWQGSSGAGGSGGQGSGAGASGSGGNGGGAGSGCGCSVPGADGQEAAWIAGLAALVGALRRRRVKALSGAQ